MVDHEIDDLWNLAEDLSITDAAALVAGYDPGMTHRCSMDTNAEIEMPRYFIALKALTNAITNGRVKVALRYRAREYGYADAMADIEASEAEVFGLNRIKGTTAEESEVVSDDDSCFYRPFPDWSLSTIARGDLVSWLTSRGIRSGFFFPNLTDAPDYLDRNNSRYAPKLAAAVRAWQAVTDPGKKSPKQALERWLREHAAEFGMVDEDGSPINQAVEECSKVANWNQGGGAPKTPS